MKNDENSLVAKGTLFKPQESFGISHESLDDSNFTFDLETIFTNNGIYHLTALSENRKSQG